MSRRRRWRPDEGYAATEFAVVMPLVLMLVMAFTQFVLYLLASDLAQTAANKGALAGASYQSSPGDGVERAAGWADGQRLLKDVAVSSAGSGPDRVRITVTGSTITVLPGWTLTIRESAEQPIEEVP